MREKEEKLVITFKSTTDAMQLEDIAKEQNIEGRLIPLPVSISASCGLAFCTMVENREKVESLDFEFDGVYLVWL